MKKIIQPIDPELIQQELTKDKFVRITNNGNKEIYIITHHNSPNVMQEIGRLREVTFRDAGGGTGKEVDIDKYDTAEIPFKQLIVWSPEDKLILGGYRYLQGKDIKTDKDGKVISPTAGLFKYSSKFIEEFLPHSIELGRSFIQPFYQATFNIRKGIYSLDNLWDGIGAMIVDNPDLKFFFGKMTMYSHFNKKARDMVLYFLNKWFPDTEKLMTPYSPLKYSMGIKELDSIFSNEKYEDDYKALFQQVRALKENIPPLMNAYMNLSPTMRTFGTAINESFGGVEETGILITIEDIYDIKKDRHIFSYKS